MAVSHESQFEILLKCNSELNLEVEVNFEVDFKVEVEDLEVEVTVHLAALYVHVATHCGCS